MFLAVVDETIAIEDVLRKTKKESVNPKGLLPVVLSLASVALMALPQVALLLVELTVPLPVALVLLHLVLMVCLLQQAEIVHPVLSHLTLKMTKEARSAST